MGRQHEQRLLYSAFLARGNMIQSLRWNSDLLKATRCTSRQLQGKDVSRDGRSNIAAGGVGGPGRPYQLIIPSLGPRRKDHRLISDKAYRLISDWASYI